MRLRSRWRGLRRLYTRWRRWIVPRRSAAAGPVFREWNGGPVRSDQAGWRGDWLDLSPLRSGAGLLAASPLRRNHGLCHAGLLPGGVSILLPAAAGCLRSDPAPFRDGAADLFRAQLYGTGDQ